jgi:hypothetical protein
VFVTLIRLITFAIQTISTFGNMLVDLAAGHPGDAVTHAVEWWKASKGHGKAIGGAVAKIFEAPDYAPAGTATKEYEASRAPKPVGASIAAVATPPAGPDTLTHATQAGKKTRLGHLARASHGGSASMHALPHAHIPKMAMGGVLTQATHFIGGEAGAEAVIPLQRPSALLAIGAALASALAAAMPPPSPVHAAMANVLSAAPTMTPGRPAMPIASPVRVALTQIEQARVTRPEANREPPMTNTFTATFNIHGAPGQSPREIGEIVERRLERFVDDAFARRRGGNHD